LDVWKQEIQEKEERKKREREEKIKREKEELEAIINYNPFGKRGVPGAGPDYSKMAAQKPIQ
jgi:hypothetical protein